MLRGLALRLFLPVSSRLPLLVLVSKSGKSKESLAEPLSEAGPLRGPSVASSGGSAVAGRDAVWGLEAVRGLDEARDREAVWGREEGREREAVCGREEARVLDAVRGREPVWGRDDWPRPWYSSTTTSLVASGWKFSSSNSANTSCNDT